MPVFPQRTPSMYQNRHPRIGFIGIGLMGRPMVLRLLLANYGVRVWNRSPDKVAEVVAAGAVPCASPAELARESDAILLSLANTRAVESVAGADDFLAALGPGSIVVDLSSISPETTRALASRVAEDAGASWIDAPVSGGVPGAETGDLVIMAGGDPEALERAREVLAPLSKRVTHMGPSGAGQTAKLCNQIIVGCNVTAIGEAFRLARAAGVDAALLPDALAGGFADSLPFRIFGQRMADGVESPVSAKIETMLKDLDGADTTATGLGLDLDLTRAAAALLRARTDQGDAERCITSMVEPPAPS